MESEPPFVETCKRLFQHKNHGGEGGGGGGGGGGGEGSSKAENNQKMHHDLMAIEECDLPLIDLDRLNVEEDHEERQKCKKDIANASRSWGFFQVVNHGIPKRVLKSMADEQKKVFHQPFNKKVEHSFLNLPANSYRWGNPLATCLKQFPWSEAFHIPLTDISVMEECNSNLSSTIKVIATKMGSLAENLAEILAENLGVKTSFFAENCPTSTCYLRMNRYPPCRIYPNSDEVVFGLMPHTDSDFLTILYQDQVGGLQLVHNGRWFNVKPLPDALIINVGDLFQAWSNGVYKSVEHRVIASGENERYSLAYFYCPYYDTLIKSCIKPAIYTDFSFKTYKEQIQKDVQATGNKVGLSRFLL